MAIALISMNSMVYCIGFYCVYDEICVSIVFTKERSSTAIGSLRRRAITSFRSRPPSAALRDGIETNVADSTDSEWVVESPWHTPEDGDDWHQPEVDECDMRTVTIHGSAQPVSRTASL